MPRPTARKRPPPKRRPPSASPAPSPAGEALFPVVAIGASAGGLEALELFLKQVPPRSGLAFVVVQHLDPTRKGLLVELLRRVSPIPVVQVEDGTRAKPDCVYVIPPNADMSIVHGVLHLLAPVEPRGLRHPIDFFLRSLAHDLGPRSVAVLLSGMGSDGAAGVRAIREKAGGVFVQSPASAKFDGMPLSAIEAGVVDAVAPAEELPGKILEYVRHARGAIRADDPEPDAKTLGEVEKIIGLLRTATGHDFSPYKTNTLRRRIERRMGLHQLPDIAQYVRYLRENPQELQVLFRELLIGVTSFFRDPEVWERLGQEVLPGLLAACPRNGVLRAWVPGCSSGEEAYSLAIAFKEALDPLAVSKSVSLQIFATDIDATAVERARQGNYPASIAADVTPERLRRFFVEEDCGYRVGKEIRSLVVFATQNVLQDPPFTRLDVLVCRNLLIYLTADAQRRLVPLFHYALRPGGTLLLGSAETIGAFTELFAPIDAKARIYRRLDTGVGAATAFDLQTVYASAPERPADPGAAAPGPEGAVPPNVQAHVESILARRFAPPAVLVDQKADILFVSGRTGKYLELPAGKANWNLLAMARDGLRHEIGGALKKAARTGRPVTLEGVSVGTDEDSRTVTVTVEPSDQPAALRGTLLVVFADGPARLARAARKGRGKGATSEGRARLERELERTQAELRTTRDEAQTAQEEHKSAHEELQSTNEELQSTNEELTTSKEEMQSMNEELQTLNSELQAKVDELSRASNDMTNLLDSTAIAVLFLDAAMNVRRFTPEAATLVKLIPSDVGRPLEDLATNLHYAGLCDDAREVLRTLVFRETSVDTRDGRHLGVRIIPYRTSDNRIDGVVITFMRLPSTEPRPARPKADLS